VDGRDGSRLRLPQAARVHDADAVRRVPGGIASRTLAPLPGVAVASGIVAPMSAAAPIDPHANSSAVFEQRRTVVPADIDDNNHVNNLRYLEWILAAALGHSEAVGWPRERYVELGATWIVRSHTIEYLRPAFVGDEVTVRTWVAQISKVSSRRKSQVRSQGGAVLVRAETLWVFVSRRAHALDRVPAELAAAFPIVPDAADPRSGGPAPVI
jgi:acyl-CoA thioester hydrolase